MDQHIQADIEELTENQQVFGVLLTLHGLVHLFGAAISWRLFEVHNFRYEDVWPAAGTSPALVGGFAWLCAAVLLGVTGARLAFRRPVGSAQIAVAAGFSAAVTLAAFPAALPGTAVSGAVLIALAVLALRRAHQRSSRGTTTTGHGA